MKSTKLVLSISTGWPCRSYRARTKWKKLDFRRLEGGCFSKWARARPTPLRTHRRKRVAFRKAMKSYLVEKSVRDISYGEGAWNKERIQFARMFCAWSDSSLSSFKYQAQLFFLFFTSLKIKSANKHSKPISPSNCRLTELLRLFLVSKGVRIYLFTFPVGIRLIKYKGVFVRERGNYFLHSEPLSVI